MRIWVIGAAFVGAIAISTPANAQGWNFFSGISVPQFVGLPFAPRAPRLPNLPTKPNVPVVSPTLPSKPVPPNVPRLPRSPSLPVFGFFR